MGAETFWGCTCTEEAWLGAGESWKAESYGSESGHFPELLTAPGAFLVLRLHLFLSAW